MSVASTYLVPTLAVATLYAVAVAYRRGRKIDVLQGLLAEAVEAQRNHDSLLTERSQLDTIKDEFISTVSHELRTPLTSIRGALGLLSAGLMGNVDAKAQNLLRIAVTNTDRLIRLINDILDLERMQSGRRSSAYTALQPARPEPAVDRYDESDGGRGAGSAWSCCWVHHRKRSTSTAMLIASCRC